MSEPELKEGQRQRDGPAGSPGIRLQLRRCPVAVMCALVWFGSFANLIVSFQLKETLVRVEGVHVPLLPGGSDSDLP